MESPELELAIDEHDFTDDELAALALAADPDEPLAPDAIPWDASSPAMGPPLPSWYMPAPMARVGQPRRKRVVFGLIVAFLVTDALGFCLTYGQLVVA
jgi:hypothetical protein